LCLKNHIALEIFLKNKHLHSSLCQM
jgi:hypothetical protein